LTRANFSGKLDSSLGRNENPKMPNPITTRNIRAAVIERDGDSCHYCCKPKLKGKGAHLDHIVPRKHGGADTIDNLVLSCARCNTQKQSSTLEDYIARRLLAIKREKNRLVELAEKHGLL
jgi:5-methylcytosine-specific restriction endonuclease McrA